MKKIIIILAAVLVLFSSCAYDDYKSDYITSMAYFSYQYPLRTLVVEPSSSEMSLKIGVPLAGKYGASDKDESVHYVIADTLVSNHPEYGIKIMPHDWYNYEDVKDGDIVIKSGDFQGSFQINIDKEKFVSDSLSNMNKYAIPVLLTGETTLDSVMVDKNFTIVLVKYVNEYDGKYSLKGVDNVSVNGVVTKKVYTVDVNKAINLTTLSKNSVVIPRVGSLISDSIIINKENSGSFIIKALPTSSISDVVGTTTFHLNSETGIKTFYNEYSFKEGSILHSVKDTLVSVNKYREIENVLEQWK